MRQAQATTGVAVPGNGIKALTIAALAGLAPIAASSAAASDTPVAAALEQSAASAAVVELVPLEVPAAAVALPAPAQAMPPAAQPEVTVLGRGGASYYAAKFHGRRTANGERFDNGGMTAAHRTLPFGTRVRVTNPANGRSVTVRINDRGPFHAGRMIDLSRAAAAEIGLVARGHGMVEIARVKG